MPTSDRSLHPAGSFLKYVEYIRLSFQKMLAYRVTYLIGIVTYIIHVAVYYFLYKSLYANGDDTIRDYALQDMLTYVSIGWISKSLYLNYIDREMTEDVQSGQVAMELIKPVDFQMVYFARGLGHSVFRLVLFTPPIVVVTTLFFTVNPPASMLHFFVFLCCTCVSVLIYLQINYIVGLLSIYFISIKGIIYSKNLIIELLSGLLIPIDWFPAWFQLMSKFLPFQAIAYFPLSVYLGRVDTNMLAKPLALQLAWFLILYVIGRLIWQICQRRILIQGG